MRGDIAAALTELRDQYDIRRRSGGGAVRPCRVHPFRHAREGRAGGRRRSLARRSRAHARARFCGEALDARALAHLADAVQGPRRGAGGRQAARRRRDGAGAHRLCGRPADARRGDPRRWTKAAAPPAPARPQWRRVPAPAPAAAPRCEARAARGAARSRSVVTRAVARDTAQPRARACRSAAPRSASRHFEDLIALAAEKRDIG